MTDLKNKLATKANNGVAAQRHSLKGLLSEVSVKKRFEDILGKKAPGFISSMLTVTNNNKLLLEANPMTIISAGAIAAALDLPIDPNLGFAYIIPYRDNKTKTVNAQFQLGYKGYIQLAMRTGQYKTINACEVYEGELMSVNRFTGEIEFGEKESDKVVGYVAYFRLLNGFEKYLYLTVEELEKHGRKFSKSYDKGLWKSDFHSMAIKTVLKRLLSKFGILSIEMQTGLSADHAVVLEDADGNNTYDYVDGQTIDGDYSTDDFGFDIDAEVDRSQAEQGAVIDVE